MLNELKTPAEWEIISGVKIYDSDGWRRGCPLGEKSFDEPISYDEFEERMLYSTIVFLPYADPDSRVRK
jgi:hypothetical protein